MTVESVTFITDLNDSYPAAGDTRTEGDDHIRNIKTGLSGTFSNFTGQAVTSTEAELNILDGVTATATELNYLDITTLGTAAASKAITASAGAAVNAAALTWTNLGAVTTTDINGGTIDGTVIGGASAAAVTGTTITASTGFVGNVTGTASKSTLTDALKVKVGAASITAGNMQVYTSTAISYSAAGLSFTAQSHGLSGRPQELEVYALCTSNDSTTGYVTNDYVRISSGTFSGATTQVGVSVWATSSQVDGKVGSNGVYILHKTAGTNAAMTTTKWSFYIIAKYYST